MLFRRFVVMFADWPRSDGLFLRGSRSRPALEASPFKGPVDLSVAPLTWAQTRSIRARRSSVSSIGTGTSGRHRPRSVEASRAWPSSPCPRDQRLFEASETASSPTASPSITLIGAALGHEVEPLESGGGVDRLGCELAIESQLIPDSLAIGTRMSNPIGCSLILPPSLSARDLLRTVEVSASGWSSLKAARARIPPRAHLGMLGHGVENCVPTMWMSQHGRKHLDRRFGVPLLHCFLPRLSQLPLMMGGVEPQHPMREQVFTANREVSNL